MSVYESVFPEVAAGGFTRADGSLQFYQRVQALLESDHVVLDYGAGRGRSSENSSKIHRAITDLRGDGRQIIGLDVDPVVMDNPRIHRAIISPDGSIPLEAESVDVIVSDHVFEHLPDPILTSKEFYRVLKPGGWICARTPYLYSLLVIGSSLIPNRSHAKVLKRVQPGGRSGRDVFPTLYRLNSNRAIKKAFPASLWKNYSYTYSPEPAYHFGRPEVVRAIMMYQYLKGFMSGEVLLIFLKKR